MKDLEKASLASQHNSSLASKTRVQVNSVNGAWTWKSALNRFIFRPLSLLLLFAIAYEFYQRLLGQIQTVQLQVLQLHHDLDLRLPAQVVSPVAHVDSYGEEEVGTIRWTTCKPDHRILPEAQCGYIIAPKDYNDPSAGTIKIALGKYPAKNGKSKGSVLCNPGGPGAPGVMLATKAGAYIAEEVGPDYDVIGFDPRGIGETLPSLKCFNDKILNYPQFVSKSPLNKGYNVLKDDPHLEEKLLMQLEWTDALFETMFKLCEISLGKEGAYMGTTLVVRDIDFITKVIDGEDALIKYWGGSYGSILGQYLIAMLPDRIGKVMVDAIADAESWANTPPHTWMKQWLSSTEDAYQYFLEQCIKAGPGRCALASLSETPSVIHALIDDLRKQLYHAPLFVSDTKHPGYLNSGKLDIFLLVMLESPQSWQMNAKALYDLLTAGDGKIIYESLTGFGVGYRDLERSGVSCNDQMLGKGRSPAPSQLVVAAEMATVLQNVSDLAMAVFPTERDEGCGHWPFSPPERFTGPWDVNPRNPVLIVSSLRDPITPVASAYKMSKFLGPKNSRLLLQDSAGHSAMSVFSNCTLNLKQNYWQKDQLFPDGTICSPDDDLFPDSQNIGTKSVFHDLIEKQRLLYRQLRIAAGRL